jgi:hypothetical protein
MRRVILALFIFSSLFTSGQSLDTTGSLLSKVPDSISNLYFISQKESLPIFTGRVFYPQTLIQGHAFVFTDDWLKGTICYDGIWYHDITFKYDVFQQELVVVTPKMISVRLISERIQRFNFNGQTFVRYNPDKDHVLKSGFYQQIETGTVTIMVHRRKIIYEQIVQTTMERNFAPLNSYYALKDGKYYPVNSQKSLLNLLGDSRKAIAKNLKRQGLKYKHDQEKYIVEAAKFYNQSHK